jgi:hypothetical protein
MPSHADSLKAEGGRQGCWCYCQAVQVQARDRPVLSRKSLHTRTLCVGAKKN